MRRWSTWIDFEWSNMFDNDSLDNPDEPVSDDTDGYNYDLCLSRELEACSFEWIPNQKRLPLFVPLWNRFVFSGSFPWTRGLTVNDEDARWSNELFGLAPCVMNQTPVLTVNESANSFFFDRTVKANKLRSLRPTADRKTTRDAKAAHPSFAATAIKGELVFRITQKGNTNSRIFLR